MSIIFPDESKMAIEDLIVFKKDLTELLYNETYSNDDINKIKEILHRLEGYLLMADKKKKFDYFDSFYELALLNILNGYLTKGIAPISFSILECIYILLTNIQNTGLIFYIYSTKYETSIPGECLNIIDKIISLDVRKREEFLTYQVNFIKSLSLKLNIDCIEFFFDKNKNQFPILNKAFSLYNNKDAMIRSAVKNIFLTILKIKDEPLRQFMTAFPNNVYYPNIIFQLRNIIMKLCLINFFDETKKNSLDTFRDIHDNLIDHMYYIGDMLLIGIENVNFILINCILNEIILPLFKTIISKKVEKVSIIFALYVLILFIHIVKNKFINDIISYFLFEDNIIKKILEKIKEYEFKSINSNLMKNINSIIINNQYADVNDLEWKTISHYMTEVNGIDLSTGFIQKDNIYDTIKNIIYNKNNNININPNDLMTKNEILINIKMLFTARDDSILLILNLLIHAELSFYLNKNDNNNNNNEKEKNNNKNENNKNINIDIDSKDSNKDENSSNSLNNIIIEKKEDNISNINNNINNENEDINKNNMTKNINNIDNELIEKIKEDLFDDDEKDEEEENNINNENIIENINNEKNVNNIIINSNEKNNEKKMNDEEYNIFLNNFLKINISDNSNLFNALLKIIEMPKNFRAITNEIILSNIYLILSNYKDEDNKKYVINKIAEILKKEIQKVRKYLSEEKKQKLQAFNNSYTAFEQYIKPLDKKVNDLISSPFILIPLIYLDSDEDTPVYLKEDKFGNQQLIIYILNIFILYDIINYLLGCQKNMIINTKQFPLQISKNEYVLGKELNEKELGEERLFYEIIINNKVIKAVIFFDFEFIYFGHILSNNYKDLSKIKILKKYKLRNIKIKIPENNDKDFENENTLLEIYDNSQVAKNKNCVVINCFKADKVKEMFNYLKQQKNTALQLEYSLFDSFIDSLERKISII